MVRTEFFAVMSLLTGLVWGGRVFESVSGSRILSVQYFVGIFSSSRQIQNGNVKQPTIESSYEIFRSLFTVSLPFDAILYMKLRKTF
jgi:hypothetical protein